MRTVLFLTQLSLGKNDRYREPPYRRCNDASSGPASSALSQLLHVQVR
jgi:hypothetical protein